MEQPKSFIEQALSKPEELEVGWPWRLLVLACFIFGITLVIFLGMKFGYEPYLDKKIKTLDAEIDKLNQSFTQSQVDNFIKFYSQLSNLKILLNNHIFGSNILKFLEENSLKNLTYSGLDLDVSRKETKLSGTISSYELLAQQLEIFRQSPLVKEVFFKKSKKNDQGGVDFEVVLILKNELFKETPSLPNSFAPSSISTSTNP